MIQILSDEHQVSIKRACSIAQLSRAAYYKPRLDWLERDRAVVEALNHIVEIERWGFWKCFDRLRLLGHRWNHKRVYRVYCEMKLNLPRKLKKRLPTRLRQSMIVMPKVNAVWAIDFMHDALYSGRAIRTFNVIDEANRECLGIDVATSIPSTRCHRRCNTCP